jgi:micrococcal nuclease
VASHFNEKTLFRNSFILTNYLPLVIINKNVCTEKLSMNNRLAKKSAILLMCMLALLTTSSAISQTPVRGVNGFVARVLDGNTLTVETKDRKKLKVRLYGIDAPELDRINRKTRRIAIPGQPFGIEAKSSLSTMVFGQDVRLEIMDSDRHRAMVSIVWKGEKNVNLEMIKAGMAEAYTEDLKDQPYRDQFIQAEKETKAKRLGIWSQGIIYERPSDFRKRMKIRVD